MSELDNKIFIGEKPFMNYVSAVVMQFTIHNADEVIILARGKFISRAVDVEEVVKNRFLKDQVELKDVKIDSEEFKSKEDKTKDKEVRVSIIEITLQRKK